MNLLSWLDDTLSSSGNVRASAAKSKAETGAKKGIYVPDRLGRLDRGTWMGPETLPDPFGRLPRAERGVVPSGLDDWFKGGVALAAPVGVSGENRPGDVAKVENLLGATGHLDLNATNGPTGYFGARTDQAVKDFQKEAGLKVDGKLTPGGETIQALGKTTGLSLSGPKPPREELMELMDAGDYSGGPSSELDDAVAETLLSLVPGVGEVMSAKDAVESGREALAAWEKGDWSKAAKSGGLAALSGLGAIPAGGIVARGGKGVAKVGRATAKTVSKLPKISRTENPVSLAEFSRIPETGTFDSRRIRTAQNTADQTFKDGRGIAEMAEGLRSGRLKPADVEPIRIVEKDGRVWTLDHRRLIAFREADVNIPYRKVGWKSLTPRQRRKFTSEDDGMSIQIAKGKKR